MMRRAGLTREQVAERLSVSIDTVDNWCRDRSTMRLPQFGAFLSMLVESGMPPREVQNLLSDLLASSGLSPEASLKLLPPARVVREDVVLFVAPDMLSRGVRFIVAGARDYLRQMGVDLLVASAYGSVPLFGSMLADTILATNPRGVILCADIDPAVIRLILDVARERKTPVIGVAHPLEFQETFTATVAIDNHALGYQSGRFLLDQGHTRIGYIGLWRAGRIGTDRLLGLQEALLKSGVTIPADGVFLGTSTLEGTATPLIDDVPSWTPLARKVLRSLSSGELTAVFCSWDPAALAIVQEAGYFDHVLEREGPVGLVVIATSRWPELVSGPRIAYFVLPLYDMGREAARLVSLTAANGAEKLTVRHIELQCQFHISDNNRARLPEVSHLANL